MNDHVTLSEYIFSDDEQDLAVELAVQKTWALVREHVDAFRLERGMSLEDFGRRIGAQKSQIHAWLSGPSNMTVRTAARLLLAAEADLEPTLTTWKEIAAEQALREDGAHHATLLVVDISPKALRSEAMRNVNFASTLRAIDQLAKSAQSHLNAVPANTADDTPAPALPENEKRAIARELKNIALSKSPTAINNLEYQLANEVA